MKLSIESEIIGESPENLLEAIYFALRYIKQATRAQRMDKNIFQDADGKSASAEIVSLTMAVVRKVERLAGGQAEDFDSATFSEVFGFLSNSAKELKGRMSDDDRISAEMLLKELAALPLNYSG